MLLTEICSVKSLHLPSIKDLAIILFSSKRVQILDLGKKKNMNLFSPFMGETKSLSSSGCKMFPFKICIYYI